MNKKEKLSKADIRLINQAEKMAKNLLWEQTSSAVRAELMGKAVANIEWQKYFKKKK